MKNETNENQIVKAGPIKSIPLANFEGETNIAGFNIRAAVLYADTENPIRVFSQREIVGLLTGNKKGGFGRYLRPKNLQPYLPDKFRDISLSDATIKYKSKNGRIAQGYIGSDVIDICKMYMTASSDRKILPSQEHLAKTASIIVFTFAKSGVDNFIDNITGYEKIRNDYELVRNINRYLSDEIRQYATQFPAEFYKLIFKLNGWDFDDESIKKRPPIVGKWTNEIIYARFPQGVLKQIQEKNPINEKGHRKYKNYNLLTEEIGLQSLQEYISNAIFLMKVSSNWRKFKNMLQRALGKEYQTELWD